MGGFLFPPSTVARLEEAAVAAWKRGAGGAGEIGRPLPLPLPFKKRVAPRSGRGAGHFWSGAAPRSGTSFRTAVLDRVGARWYGFGAQAVVVYGRPRLTADLDITVDVRVESWQELEAPLERAGFSSRANDLPAFVRRTRVLPLVRTLSGIPVDLVLAGTCSCAVLLCWMALLLVRLIESETGQTWTLVRDEPEHIHRVDLCTRDGAFQVVTKATAEQRKLSKTLNIPPPKPVRGARLGPVEARTQPLSGLSVSP